MISWLLSIRAILLLLLYSFALLFLYFSGRLVFFLHPDYFSLVLFAGIALLFFGVMILVQMFRGKFTQKMDGFDFALFLVPLLFIFCVQPKSLSANWMNGTDIMASGNAVFSRQVKEVNRFIFNSENRTLTEWLQLLIQDPEPDHYVGTRVKVKGFVSQDPSFPSGYFMISRYVISCCAADARIVGIPVQMDEKIVSGISDLNVNEWIEIQGKFQTDEIEGEQMVVIAPVAFQRISEPQNPYET